MIQITRFIIFTFFAWLCVSNLYAQDIITKKDGSKIEVKIVEVNSEVIKYYSFDQLEGPIRILQTYELTKIKYENGIIEKYDVKPPVTSNRFNQGAKRREPKYAPLDMMGSGFALDFLLGTSQYKQIKPLYFNSSGQSVIGQNQTKIINFLDIGLRFSNKFYFDVLPNWRTGIQVSYMRLSAMLNDSNSEIFYYSFSPLNIGTANIFRINENFGFEANLVVGPTLTGYDLLETNDTGFTINPELKMRFKQLAIGFDYSRMAISHQYYNVRLHQFSFTIGLKV